METNEFFTRLKMELELKEIVSSEEFENYVKQEIVRIKDEYFENYLAKYFRLIQFYDQILNKNIHHDENPYLQELLTIIKNPISITRLEINIVYDFDTYLTKTEAYHAFLFALLNDKTFNSEMPSFEVIHHHLGKFYESRGKLQFELTNLICLFENKFGALWLFSDGKVFEMNTFEIMLRFEEFSNKYLSWREKKFPNDKSEGHIKKSIFSKSHEAVNIEMFSEFFNLPFLLLENTNMEYKDNSRLVQYLSGEITLSELKENGILRKLKLLRVNDIGLIAVISLFKAIHIVYPENKIVLLNTVMRNLFSDINSTYALKKSEGYLGASFYRLKSIQMHSLIEMDKSVFNDINDFQSSFSTNSKILQQFKENFISKISN